MYTSHFALRLVEMVIFKVGYWVADHIVIPIVEALQ